MAVLFVSKNTGADTNDGLTPESPKRTIQAAINTAIAGDTIYVGPGEYQEIVSTKTDIINGRVEIIADRFAEKLVYDIPGEVSISGRLKSDGTYDGTVLTIGLYMYQNYTIKGFVFNRHTGYDILVGGPNIIIEDCEFFSLARAAIRETGGVNLDGMKVENCKFYAQGRTDDTIWFNYGSSGTVRITNCDFFGGAEGTAIYKYSADNMKLIIQGCSFDGFHYSFRAYIARNQNTYFYGCEFRNAEVAIYTSNYNNHIYVNNCVFRGNRHGIQYGHYAYVYLTYCHFYRNLNVANHSFANQYCNFHENYSMWGLVPSLSASFKEYDIDFPLPYGIKTDRKNPINGLQSGKLFVSNSGHTDFDIPVERGVATTVRLSAIKNFVGTVKVKFGSKEIVMEDNDLLQTLEITWTPKVRRFEKLHITAETTDENSTDAFQALTIDDIKVY